MTKIARQSKPFLNQKSEGAIESLRSQHVQPIFVFAAGVSMSQKNEPIDHSQECFVARNLRSAFNTLSWQV